MTITLFERTNRRGSSQVIRGDISDLRGRSIDKPGSIRMTAASDEILLFRNDDWRGGVLYLRGRQTINNLGSSRQGGRNGFGNSIRSVRVTPFVIDLNITVVKNSAGDLPGRWSTEAQAESGIQMMLNRMNSFLRREQALLQVREARITFRTDNNRFVMRRSQGTPARWKQRGEVDVVIVNRFHNEGLFGVGSFPHGGQVVRIAGVLNPTEGQDIELNGSFMSLVLMHELGHYLGLAHGTAGPNSGNLMFASADEDVDRLTNQVFTQAQNREIHQRLARNLSRRRDRASV